MNFLPGMHPGMIIAPGGLTVPLRGFNAANFIQGTEYLRVDDVSAGDRTEFIMLFNVERSGALFEYMAGHWDNVDTGDVIGFDASGEFRVHFGGVSTTHLLTRAQFTADEMFSFVVSIDTDNATADDRIRVWELYAEQQELTSFGTRNNPALGAQSAAFNTASEWSIGSGRINLTGSNRFNGDVGLFMLLDGVSIQQGDYSISDFYDVVGTTHFLKDVEALAAIAATVGGNSRVFDMADDTDFPNDASSNNNDAADVTGTPGQLTYFQRGIASDETRHLVPASNFDGSTDLNASGGLTGVADGRVGTFSCWFNAAAFGTTRYLFQISERTFFFMNTSNEFEVLLRNSSNADRLLLNGDTAFASAGWHHVIVSWDLVNDNVHLFIDDVDDLVGGPTTSINGDVDQTFGDSHVAAQSGSAFRWDGDIAELFYDDRYIDLTVEANRRQFITDGLKPANLALLSQPKTLLTQRFATFQENQGSGGDYTESGTITRAATSPSDPATADIDPTGLTTIGGATGGGGLAAAFNGTTSVAAASGARAFTAADCWLGLDLGVGVTKSIASFIVYAPNNATFTANTATIIEFELRGSDTAPTLKDDGTLLYKRTEFPTPAANETIDVDDLVSTQPFRYIWLAVNGTTQISVAELELREFS